MSLETPKASKIMARNATSAGEAGGAKHDQTTPGPSPTTPHAALPPAIRGNGNGSGPSWPSTPASVTDSEASSTYFGDSSFDSSSATSGRDLGESPSSRSRYGAIELSLPTQRRLIRKPLPDLPGAEPRKPSGRSPTPRVRTALDAHKQRLRARERLDAWWPEELPRFELGEEVGAASAAAGRLAVAADGEGALQSIGPGLDQQSALHLRSIVAFASADRGAAGGVNGVPNALGIDAGEASATLPPLLQAAIYAAVLELLRSLSAPATLSALQRTAAMRWRAEATLRAAATAAAAASSATLSAESQSATANLAQRLARLAWPAVALGRAGSARHEVQLSAAAARHAGDAAIEADVEDGEAGNAEHRTRKRDVAIKILSNAVWLARVYGAGAGALVGLGGDVLYGPVAPAKAEESTTSTDKRGSLGAGPGVSKRGPPHFIKVSAPTTALSQADPSENISSSSSAVSTPVSDKPGGSSVTDSSDSERTAFDRTPTGSSFLAPGPSTAKAEMTEASNGAAAEAAGSAPAKPAAPTSQPSKAMERLSSLNIAAGAAVASRLRAQADGTGSDTLSTPTASRRSSASITPSGLPNLSATQNMSEAERAETEALERAQKEWQARIGKGCEEWAKVTVCRLCVKVERGGGEEGASMHTVKWRAGSFEGKELFKPPSPAVGAKPDEEAQARMRLVGGTLTLRVETAEEETWATSVLQTAVFAGCAMLLEMSLLADLGLARPPVAPATPPKRALSLPTRKQTLPSPDAEISSKAPTPPDSAPIAAYGSSDQGHNDSTHRSARRWTRGIFSAIPSSKDTGTSDAANADAESREGVHFPSGESTPGGPSSAVSSRRSSFARPNEDDEDDSHGHKLRKPSLSGLGGVLRSAGHRHREGSSDTITARSAGMPRSHTLSTPTPAAGDRHHSGLTKQINHRIGKLFSYWSGRDRTHSDATAVGSAVPEGIEEEGEGGSATQLTRKPSSPDRTNTRALVAEEWSGPLPAGPAPLCTSPDVSYSGDFCKEAAVASGGSAGRNFIHSFREHQLLVTLSDAEGVASNRAGGLTALESNGTDGVNGHSSNAATPAPSAPPTPLLGPSATPAKPGKTNSKAGPSSSPSLSPWHRETTVFYEHMRPGEADVPLGQMLESLAAEVERSQAALLEARDKSKSGVNGSSSGGTARGAAPGKSVSVNINSPASRTISYILSGQRIAISARWTGSTTGAGGATISTVGPGADDALAAKSVSAQQATDVRAVAAALQTDQDAAASAIAAAETAIKTVEGSATPGSTAPVEKALGGEFAIWTWEQGPGTDQSGIRKSATVLSEGSYLLSFAKFLETMALHPALRKRDRGVSAESGDSDQGEGAAKAPLAQFFKLRDVLVKVQVSPLRVYELQIDGPVVRDAAAAEASCSAPAPKTQDPTPLEIVTEQTRRDVQAFFASVKGHVTTMEQIFVGRELDDAGRTIKPTAANTGTASSTSAGTHGALTLLTRLKASLRNDEFDLYEALKSADVWTINDVRKAFSDRLKSAKKRLNAWVNKHLTKAELKELGALDFIEPEYTLKGRHTFPGSHLIVREDEPLSIIGFSLSSRDYRAELKAYRSAKADTTGDDDLVDDPRRAKDAQVLDWRRSVVVGSSGSSQISTGRFSLAESLERRSKAPPGTPLDPDRDEVFHESEPVQVRMKRKRRGREGSILSLTLRRVGSTISAHSEAQSTSAASSSARQTVQKDDLSDATSLQAPASTVGTDGDDGSSSADPTTPTTSRIVSSDFGRGGATGTITSEATDSTFRAHVGQMRARPQSLASIFAPSVDGTEAPDRTPTMADSAHAVDGAAAASGGTEGPDSSTPPATPSAPGASSLWSMGSGFQSFQRRVPDGVTSRIASDNLSIPSTMDDKASQLGTSLGTSGGVPPSITSSKPPLAESPHIKHVLQHGNIKVSCVSWFAEEFATMRRKWGVEEGFADSLSRCNPWQAIGGKSKSAFFKTADERWIAKQLLTVWSVDEKEAFLEFAPAYLRYMMNSAVNECPTLLVKVGGVFSLKVKDVQTGEVKLRMNLIILENLFCGDEDRSIRFDLKGIRDRRVRAAPGSDEHLPPVWWDSEWIETFKPQAYVPERQRELFLRAMNNDLHFLTESNIMDFSLLVGVSAPEGGRPNPSDGEDKDAALSSIPTFRVRIIDFVAAFTLAKQLESSSKKALKSGTAKEAVTILPPLEYAARFRSALEGYFIGCPMNHVETTSAGGSRRLSRREREQLSEMRVAALPAVL